MASISLISKEICWAGHEYMNGGFFLIFISKLGILSFGHHRGHIGHLRPQIYMLQT